MLVLRNCKMYSFEFCIIVSVDPHELARLVLYDFFKDCVFGEALSLCPNRMTKNTDFRTIPHKAQEMQRFK